MSPVVGLIDAGAGEGPDQRLHRGRLGDDVRSAALGRRLQAAKEVSDELGYGLSRAPGIGFGASDEPLFQA